MRNLRIIGVLALLVSVVFVMTSAYQVLPTGVRITVLNKMGTPVENAKVTLFANEADYENEQNAVAGPVFTDEKGRVTIKNLEEIQYYVQVVNGDESNYGEAEKTDKLEKNKINKFNIIIE
ncbi:MAG: carboxypeptidase-like regulatory domain-containing protein [Cyclobacteriaceae bacterium]|nr:carboxypeptidase-like regulatory domain-containing protein [Cyclobacteriaceae bacterium]